MKKKVMTVLLAAGLLLAAIPAAAEQELTDVTPEGTTQVEADILDTDSGAVSYIISIPEKIDFGTLQMPEDDTTAHNKTVGFTVAAVEVNGLDATNQRIAVLMKDSVTGDKTFQIKQISGTGVADETTDLKVLNYLVYTATGTNVASGDMYTNGMGFAAFHAAGQSVDGTLSLDQNQLLSDTNIANWAGDYAGTINFYTKIVSLTQITSLE